MLSLLLAVPSCIYSFWHGVIPTSYFIFNDFYTCTCTCRNIWALHGGADTDVQEFIQGFEFGGETTMLRVCPPLGGGGMLPQKIF